MLSDVHVLRSQVAEGGAGQHGVEPNTMMLPHRHSCNKHTGSELLPNILVSSGEMQEGGQEVQHGEWGGGGGWWGKKIK